nr:hypothetical protein [Tanacetum cinerariifolium]
MAGVDINTLTMEQYLALSRENRASGVVKPEIKGNVNFEIKSQFMRELREDTFSENKNKDAHDHIDRVLNIVSLFNIPGVSKYVVLLRVFLFTLTGSTKIWVDRLTPGAINTWDLFKKAFIQRTLSRNISSNNITDGLAAVISKLDNLGHDIKNLKENFHVIQVGCQICEGPYLDNEFPLNEEVKPVEEVKYDEFERLAGSIGAKFRVGPSKFYTRTDNRPPYGEKRPNLEELTNKHQEESVRRSTKMEEWIKKLQENTEINTRNQSTSLKNLETQIEQLTKKLYSRTINEAPSSSIEQCASVNVMPRNIFEYLRLANLRNTNMLVEMADMTKHAPL